MDVCRGGASSRFSSARKRDVPRSAEKGTVSRRSRGRANIGPRFFFVGEFAIHQPVAFIVAATGRSPRFTLDTLYMNLDTLFFGPLHFFYLVSYLTEQTRAHVLLSCLIERLGFIRWL